MLGINFNYQPVLDILDDFLGTKGRMKFCRPVYRELVKCDKLELGRTLYKKHKKFYHVIAGKMI